MTIKPHLACDADIEKIKFPILGLPKIDGVRLLHITGTATGRSLKAHGNKHITAKYSDAKYAWLDGELSYGDITSESLCRDTTSVVSRIEGTPDVKWNIFDYLHPDWINKPYLDRITKAKSVVNELNDPSLAVVSWDRLFDLSEVEEFYRKCLDLGYEGIILRDIDGVHKSGRATVKQGAYLRMKPQSDKEARVVRLVEAMENQNEAKINELGRTERSSHKENKVGKGMVGMLVCKDLETGLEIDVGAGKLTHEERIYYWNNPGEMVDQIIKYRSMDKGVKNLPRFARYICKRSESDIS